MIEKTGYLELEELQTLPGFPGRGVLKRKKCAVIECKQHIPCNPCTAACPHGAITMGDSITKLPAIDPEKCVGCGICVAKCPGLAIFVVDESPADHDTVMLPYEHLPIPAVGDEVYALNRTGECVAKGKVSKVLNSKALDKTPLVEVAVEKGLGMQVRNIRTMDKPLSAQNQFPAAAPELFIDVAGDNMLVCRCEELTKGEILEAVRNGARSVDDVKRLTRAGMGLCQGRNCRKTIERLISSELKKDLADMPPASRRAPVRALKMNVFSQQWIQENQ